jgi:hypothetical protein
MFTELLHNFLERLLKNWPLGDSYCLLIGILQNSIINIKIKIKFPN